jgi:hypothetical protein
MVSAAKMKHEARPRGEIEPDHHRQPAVMSDVPEALSLMTELDCLQPP